MRNRKFQDEKHWISFSDMMTGLMVIFLFIAISYMVEANKKENQIEQILEFYENTRDSIRHDLVVLLGEHEGDWGEFVEFDSINLSIKFVGGDIQFQPDSDRIRSSFRNILDDFIPKYIAVISQQKYQDKIAEVRIEGHANRVTGSTSSSSEYMEGVKWSQRRAKEVLKYFVRNRTFRNLTPAKKRRLQFWLVANGYSYGRTLDRQGAYSELSKEMVCEECSRRVEFRIVTVSEQIIADIISKLNT